MHSSFEYPHAQAKFPADLCNTLDVSVEFPASISADSLLTVRTAIKLGPNGFLFLWPLEKLKALEILISR